jgi:hypothetical protein
MSESKIKSISFMCFFVPRNFVPNSAKWLKIIFIFSDFNRFKRNLLKMT